MEESDSSSDDEPVVAPPRGGARSRNQVLRSRAHDLQREKESRRKLGADTRWPGASRKRMKKLNAVRKGNDKSLNPKANHDPRRKRDENSNPAEWSPATRDRIQKALKPMLAAKARLDGLQQHELTKDKVRDALSELKKAKKIVEGSKEAHKEWQLFPEVRRLEQEARQREVRVRLVCDTMSGDRLFDSGVETCRVDELDYAPNAPVNCLIPKVKEMGREFKTKLETTAFQRWKAEAGTGAVADFRAGVKNASYAFASGEDLFFEKIVLGDARDPERATELFLSADLRLFDRRAEPEDPPITLVLVLHSDIMDRDGHSHGHDVFEVDIEKDAVSGGGRITNAEIWYEAEKNAMKKAPGTSMKRKTAAGGSSSSVAAGTVTGGVGLPAATHPVGLRVGRSARRDRGEGRCFRFADPARAEKAWAALRIAANVVAQADVLWSETLQNMVDRSASSGGRAAASGAAASSSAGGAAASSSAGGAAASSSAGGAATSSSAGGAAASSSVGGAAASSSRAAPASTPASAGAWKGRDGLDAPPLAPLTCKTAEMALAVSSIQPRFAVGEDKAAYRKPTLQLALDLPSLSFRLRKSHTLQALVPYVTTPEYRSHHDLGAGEPVLQYRLFAVLKPGTDPAQDEEESGSGAESDA